MQVLGEFAEALGRRASALFPLSISDLLLLVLIDSESLRDRIVDAPEGEVLVRQATNDEKWGNTLPLPSSPL